MRNGFRVVDTDCHQIEPTTIWVDYIDPVFRERAPRPGHVGGRTMRPLKGEGESSTHEHKVDAATTQLLSVMMVEGEPFTNEHGKYPMSPPEFLAAQVKAMERFKRAREAGFDPRSRLADMDEQGVDAQVLYPTTGAQLLGKPFKDVELLAACCRAYNDWCHAYCQTDPRRLHMAAMLPVQAVDLAIEEARRCAARGVSGFFVRPNPVLGRNLYHEDYDPLWAELERLGKPICMHDSGSPYWASYGDRMETHTSGHMLAHPFEAMAAMMSLIWYGVIERFPGLRVVHVEADAGWLPYWLQRMEQHWDFSGNAEHPLLKKRPTEYFECNFLVACRGDERTLPAAVELVGDANLTFNTDYPHPDGTWPWGMEALERQPIPRESVRRIFWDNAARFFHLEV